MVDELDYDLPPEAIAQHPVEPRDAARLLVGLVDPPADRTIADLPDLLEPGDVLVVNDTRVVPARLRLRKPTGGQAEVLLLRPLDGALWEAMVRGRLRVGTVLSDAVELVERRDDTWIVRLLADPVGEVPLPPYIHEELSDPERYQTVYARHPGSVAAPTAGLHLTHEVLSRCKARDVRVAALDLTVGLDTFRPMTPDHRMHGEAYAIPHDTWDALAGRRVVAVGTTTVRALESAARTGALAGTTDLFIRPGFEFRVVDVLLTNFHLPRTTLLLMVEAFVGPRWRRLYDTALARGYRFLSFGDAMLVAREA